MKFLLVAAWVLFAAAPVRAEEPEAAPEPSAFSFYRGTHFGVQLDAGLPSGAGLTLVARPWKLIRIDAGAGYNLVGYGIKGGVTLVPFHWWVTPTLGLSAGHFFPGDAGRFAKNADAAARILLSRVGYDYAALDLGLEIGGQNRFVFFLRAGLAQLRPSVRNVNEAIQAANPSLRVTAADPTLSARIPTARLGFLVYLF